MYDPFSHLPKKYQAKITWLRSKRLHPKIVFITLGILSTLWFLIRVIPKPSRATYPCMQATAPYMSAFVLWLIGVWGGLFSVKQWRFYLAQSRYPLAFLFMVAASISYLLMQYAQPTPAGARPFDSSSSYFVPNNPIGEARGIFPGRVIWFWDENATNENCTNTSDADGMINADDDAWFMEKNNDVNVIDSMMRESLKLLTGGESATASWDFLFRYFNQNHGLGDIGYSQGEKVFIKVNATTALGGLADERFDAELRRNDDQEVNNFAAETNPYVVLSMLRQLVYEAGVPEEYIYVGDPARNIYKEFYDLWKGEFPELRVLGNNLIHPELEIEDLGRIPVAHTTTDKIFYSDHGEVMEEAISDKLFTLFDEVDYMINIPTMKAHSSAGITLAAKNHFGSLPRTWAMHVHPGLLSEYNDNPQRLGYGLYRTQTDIMMHKLLSGKYLLMIVDGLYPGENAQATPDKWQMPPFNNDWASSLFFSLDPVAIEAVCHDFLRTEYQGATYAENRPNWNGVDDYLQQAADSALWPDGITYDPDGDGELIASLGVHEHWNDSLQKQYSRNLNTGEGIELIKGHDNTLEIKEIPSPIGVRVYPNPVRKWLTISNADGQNYHYQLFNIRGELLKAGTLNKKENLRLDMRRYAKGIFLLKVSKGTTSKTIKINKQ